MKKFQVKEGHTIAYGISLFRKMFERPEHDARPFISSSL